MLRDCCLGEVLPPRSLLGATESDLIPLLEEVASICQTLDLPIAGVSTDGQHSMHNIQCICAVSNALPMVT